MPLDFGNVDTIGYIVAAITIPLFSFLGVIATAVFKSRTEAREARNEAHKAAAGISTIDTNTQALDGFPDRMDRKLDEIRQATSRLESRLTRVEDTVTDHLRWHVDREGKRR